MIITVQGNPPRKDDHWRVVSPRDRRAFMALTPAGRQFREATRIATRQALADGQVFPEGPFFAVAITMYVPRWSKQYGCPLRDIDSAISPVFDALQNAGFFENDMQVEHLHPPQRFLDRKDPRTTIEVTHWPRKEETAP